MRLKEANLSLRRFLKVDDLKRAFEKEWQNKLYTPEELPNYHSWGICGGEGLVLIDADNSEMAELLRNVLPPTFEVCSARRRLPHFYFKVIDGTVQNKTLYLPETNKAAGEIRADQSACRRQTGYRGHRQDLDHPDAQDLAGRSALSTGSGRGLNPGSSQMCLDPNSGSWRLGNGASFLVESEDYVQKFARPQAVVILSDGWTVSAAKTVTTNSRLVGFQSI